jgi:hypothetical protein
MRKHAQTVHATAKADTTLGKEAPPQSNLDCIKRYCGGTYFAEL